jgi:hypothetical protein
MKAVFHRLYADFFLPQRSADYRAILEKAVEKKYKHYTLPEYYSLLKNGLPADDDQRIFIHRHDIDTDSNTALLFYKAEKEYQIKASYYFRLSTLNKDIMQRLHTDGFEVGYHFEEIADYCKKHRIFSAGELPQHYSAIRDLFKTQLRHVEKTAGFKIRSIASHGDFVNRKLKTPNYAFITEELLSECGLEFECYNPLLTQSFTTMCSDAPYPNFYRGTTPLEAITAGHKRIHFLSHPRHWKSAPWINLKDNLNRAKEEIPFLLQRNKN